MTRFRPCIDLHSGQVKQIVGGTLTTTSEDLKTNYVSKLPASHFARLYKENELAGAHVIMLGPGNDDAAKDALAAWPSGLQVGGGITDKNAKQWIDLGAEKVRLDHVMRRVFENVEKKSPLSKLCRISAAKGFMGRTWLMRNSRSS
jgi:phosphoribosylformimino-5-aminoimidazole carboxamide ribotide isomerase